MKMKETQTSIFNIYSKKLNIYENLEKKDRHFWDIKKLEMLERDLRGRVSVME